MLMVEVQCQVKKSAPTSIMSSEAIESQR